jgi:hypothetical protein
MAAQAQNSTVFYFQPNVLAVGSGAVRLSLFPPVALPPAVAAKVNGVDRPIAPDNSGSGRYAIALTAADVAHPGLAEIVLYDSKQQTTLAASYVPNSYPVQPTGIAWDRPAIVGPLPPAHHPSRLTVLCGSGVVSPNWSTTSRTWQPARDKARKRGVWITLLS